MDRLANAMDLLSIVASRMGIGRGYGDRVRRVRKQ